MSRRVSSWWVAFLFLLVPISALGCSGPDIPADIADEVLAQPRTVVVDRSDSVLRYFENGEHVDSTDVVVGAPTSPTPLGIARIWKSEPMDEEGSYGAWRLSIEYESNSGEWDRAAFAIHGTNHPELLGERAPRFFSNGCIRLPNDKILWLADRLGEGDIVYVVP